MHKFEVWTDGACSGNPGPGGYAAVVYAPDHLLEIVGGEPHTTNNRMELWAAIAALETLPAQSTIQLTSDSEYVVKGITEWMPAWKRRAWKKVKNRDLWERLDRATLQHAVSWCWVRGHSGHPRNEYADRLAVEEAARQSSGASDPGPRQRRLALPEE